MNRLLHDKTYPHLEIEIWLNVNFVLLFNFILRITKLSQTSGGFELASTGKH